MFDYLSKTRPDQFARCALACALTAFLLAFPMIAAAGSSGPGGIDTNFGVSQSDAENIVGSIQKWWSLAANVGVYGGAIVAVVAIMAGFSMRVIYIAVAIALVGGFGQPVLQWLLNTGGMNIIQGSSSS